MSLITSEPELEAQLMASAACRLPRLVMGAGRRVAHRAEGDAKRIAGVGDVEQLLLAVERALGQLALLLGFECEAAIELDHCAIGTFADLQPDQLVGQWRVLWHRSRRRKRATVEHDRVHHDDRVGAERVSVQPLLDHDRHHLLRAAIPTPVSNRTATAIPERSPNLTMTLSNSTSPQRDSAAVPL